MGGNALTVNPGIRLDKAQYESVAHRCVSLLRAKYPNNRVDALQAYRQKQTFGDLDILVESKGYDPLQAAEALDAVEVVRNGPVTSIGVRVQPEVSHLEGNVFQVDLLKTVPEEYAFASAYFSWNDAGNLLGRLAHAMGLALRHDALVYYLRDGDYQFCEIVLTRDWSLALEFLGYEPSRYSAGFDTLEEIYEFVASSQKFNRDIFLLENRNAKSRIRDRKRPTYRGFLKWCESHSELPSYEYPNDKSFWLAPIAGFFPHFQAEYDQALAALAEQRAVKAKFSGAWVSQITGLTGTELGGLMKRFKESFDSPEAQRAFVLSHSQQDIEVRVRRVLESGRAVGLAS